MLFCTVFRMLLNTFALGRCYTDRTSEGIANLKKLSRLQSLKQLIGDHFPLTFLKEVSQLLSKLIGMKKLTKLKSLMTLLKRIDIS
jgi:hypothetical protein